MEGMAMASNKVALITGCGKKRVGYHIAEALAKRGYSIVVHYHSSEEDARDTAAYFERSYSVETLVFQADLADEAAVTRMVTASYERFGQVDLLVNAAAIWKRKKLEETTAADVREHFDTNTLGTFLPTQQIGLRMTKQPNGGLIVMIGDWAEARPYLDYAAYFPSKGAVSTLTRVMAVELGTRNPKVRVNAILPGPVMLPDDMPNSEKEEVIAATLVKREGTPQHVAMAVLSFLDNDFITGACLPVDGGRTIYAAD